MISRPSDCETQRCRSTATFSPAVIGIAQNRAQAAISCPRFANKSPMKCGEVQFRVVTGKAGTNKRRVFKHCIAGTCSQHPKRDWRTKHKRTRRHCEPSRLVKRAAKWVGSGRDPRRRLVVCVGSRFLLHHLT